MRRLFKYIRLPLVLLITLIGSLEAQDTQLEEVDLRIEINKTAQVIKTITRPKETANRPTLIKRFEGLEYSPATRELAASRRRASLDGMFLGQRRGNVGYRPIISFFPQGDMMMAGPVIVSPDRRYVRVGISAARTGIGNVYTFNFSTGKYQLLNNQNGN